MRILIGWLGAALLLALFIATYMAYFVVVPGGAEIVHDGLGRQIYPAPAFLAWIHELDYWPGLKWWFVDMVVFWAGFIAAMYVIAYGFGADAKE